MGTLRHHDSAICVTSMKLGLSIIIPAYNESRRLPPFLDSVRAYCDALFPADYQIIVVDDGSTDDTPQVVEDLAARWEQLALVCHPHNQGKGAAVRTGLRAGAGDLLLVSDADGAFPIQEERKLRTAILGGADLAVGSRLLQGSRLCSPRHWLRAASTLVFACAARGAFGMSVRDTQCGFKMFRRSAAQQLLGACRESGYLIDVELLAWAYRLGHQVAEVPVTWRDVPGSRVRPVRDGLRMLGGLVRLRSNWDRRLGSNGGIGEDPQWPTPISPTD